MIPGLAVIAAAIEDAEGFPITRMPISPSELFELRRGTRRRGPGEELRQKRGARRRRTRMKITGEATLHAPLERVWWALNDPAVLVRTIPGCQQLEETGPDAYRMTVTAGSPRSRARTTARCASPTSRSRLVRAARRRAPVRRAR